MSNCVITNYSILTGGGPAGPFSRSGWAAPDSFLVCSLAVQLIAINSIMYQSVQEVILHVKDYFER